MKIGYARVSTRDQNLELQLDALNKAGCETIYQEKVSGASASRPELERLLTQLRTGHTIYIYKLDRLGRSLCHPLKVVGDLQQLGVGLVSLTDSINTTSAQGRLVFNLFASLAEFERELIRERTHAGLASSRARGRVGGRQRGLSEEARRTAIVAETLYREQQLGVNEIAQRLHISKVTLYKYLRYHKVVIHAHHKPAANNPPVNFCAKLLTKTNYGIKGKNILSSQKNTSLKKHKRTKNLAFLLIYTNPLL